MQHILQILCFLYVITYNSCFYVMHPTKLLQPVLICPNAGNLLILVTVSVFMPKTSVINVMISSLAVADFMVLAFCAPFQVMEAWWDLRRPNWPFAGTFVCYKNVLSPYPFPLWTEILSLARQEKFWAQFPVLYRDYVIMWYAFGNWGLWVYCMSPKIGLNALNYPPEESYKRHIHFETCIIWFLSLCVRDQ